MEPQKASGWTQSAWQRMWSRFTSREVARLRERIRELEAVEAVRKHLELRANRYHLSKPVRGRHQGPYCTTCFDEDGILVTLHYRAGVVSRAQGDTNERWECGRCVNKRAQKAQR